MRLQCFVIFMAVNLTISGRRGWIDGGGAFRLTSALEDVRSSTDHFSPSSSRFGRGTRRRRLALGDAVQDLAAADADAAAVVRLHLELLATFAD